MSDFSGAFEEDPFADPYADPYAAGGMGGGELDPDQAAILTALAQLMNRGGQRSSFSQKKGLMTYQDPTQVPYDTVSGLNNLEKFTDVPISAYLSSGMEPVKAYYEAPQQSIAGVYASRADFTGQVIAAALQDLEDGEDISTVAGKVSQIAGAPPEGQEFDPAEYTQALTSFQQSTAERNAARAKWEAENGLEPGAALRSLQGEKFDKAVPVAKGLPAGPLGMEAYETGAMPRPDDIIAALDQDKAFTTVNGLERTGGAVGTQNSSARAAEDRPHTNIATGGATDTSKVPAAEQMAAYRRNMNLGAIGTGLDAGLAGVAGAPNAMFQMPGPQTRRGPGPDGERVRSVAHAPAPRTGIDQVVAAATRGATDNGPRRGAGPAPARQSTRVDRPSAPTMRQTTQVNNEFRAGVMAALQRRFMQDGVGQRPTAAQRAVTSRQEMLARLLGQ